MKPRGQFQLEAAVSFAVFLAIIFSFLGVVLFQSEKASEAEDAFLAKAEAQKCSLIINSIYANSGGTLENLKANCFVEEKNFVSGSSGSLTKKSFIFPEKVKMVQTPQHLSLEVSVNEHYG